MPGLKAFHFPIAKYASGKDAVYQDHKAELPSYVVYDNGQGIAEIAGLKTAEQLAAAVAQVIKVNENPGTAKPAVDNRQASATTVKRSPNGANVDQRAQHRKAH